MDKVQNFHNPFVSLLRDLTPKPQVAATAALYHLDDEDKRLLRHLGITAADLIKEVNLDTTINWDRSRLYGEVGKACFTGDTKVNLLDGSTPTLKEMSEKPDFYIGKYVLSVIPENNDLEPDKIIHVGKTRDNAELVRVYLDNNEHIDCTPDHDFMIITGWDKLHIRYKEAKYLKSTDVLRCLNKTVKVSFVENLNQKQDVYDIQTEKNHNFPLEAGVFVHNCDHWYIGPALQIYADYATAYDNTKGYTVGIISDNSVYQKELTKLLERIGIEERINDWANMVAAYGDLFVELKGKPDYGLYAIADDEHPLNISRIDHDGCLIGFYKTPQGNMPTTQDKEHNEIISPYRYSHFRLLNTVRRRVMWGDPNYTEYRTMQLVTGADTRPITSKYGSSLIASGLPAWKRLRLAEDSLLMAAILRRPVRYIFKLMTSSQNAEAVNEVLEMYKSVLLKARAIDTRAESPNYESKFNPLSSVENILMPVWNDNNGDVQIEKLGGDIDVKWIADVELLMNQLACTIRVPLSLLGGFVKEATGSLGSEAIEKLDIGFARNARKLQRALRQGIKRICQVHLAYMNLDPDPSLFDVDMNESNSIIEDQTRESLDKGVEVVDKILDSLEKVGIEEPKIKQDIANYFMKKVLKLDDFDLTEFTGGKRTSFNNEKIDDNIKETQNIRKRRIDNMDLLAYLPMNETYNRGVLSLRSENDWRRIVTNESRIVLTEANKE